MKKKWKSNFQNMNQHTFYNFMINDKWTEKCVQFKTDVSHVSQVDGTKIMVIMIIVKTTTKYNDCILFIAIN